jgi:hypothetical protein
VDEFGVGDFMFAVLETAIVLLVLFPPGPVALLDTSFELGISYIDAETNGTPAVLASVGVVIDTVESDAAGPDVADKCAVPDR